MHRRVLFTLLGLAALAGAAEPAHGAEPQWIWTDEGTPIVAPAGSRFFRRSFTIDRPIADPVGDAALEITADDGFRVWINGTFVGEGKEWQKLQRYDVRKLLVHGGNVIAIEGFNAAGPAGLIVKLTFTPVGKPRQTIVSDATWKTAPKVADGWQKAGFDDHTWTAVKVFGPHGKTAPWQGLVWGLKSRFTVPDGFRVEEVCINPMPPGKAFSLVNMTFDNQGRLLASQEGGPILLCTEPNAVGVFQKVRPFCEIVKNCQGMCWYKDALLLVGEGPKGTGLYRCTDTAHADKIDKAELLVPFHGGIGEHGPHAVRLGPDGSIYVICGNHSQVDVKKWTELVTPRPEGMAKNAPLLRWPNGVAGPDQGKPGSPEDVLLPRLNDARGHAADILAPGGTIWRLDPDGKNLAMVAAGFRNHFDIAFNPAGELFTFDSDMEWDEGLPWYRHVRICHCPPGADYVWRTGAANTPNYYIDSLPPLYETGRGSPVGLEFYDHYHFGKEYRGCYFMADWSIGVIWAVHLEQAGATWKARKVEKFVQGAPMNVTDLEVGPDGALYFVMGGRGSQGGIFRIVRDEGAGTEPPMPSDPARVDAWKVDLIEQPLSAWSRNLVDALPPEKAAVFQRVANDPKATPATRVRALTLLQLHPATQPAAPTFEAMLVNLAKDPSPEVRAEALLLLGAHGAKDLRTVLVAALADADPTVRRRACEALIRAGIEPPLDALWPLLAEKDIFLATAARLVLQRIEPSQWAPRLVSEKDDRIVRQGLVALCKIDKAPIHDLPILTRLASSKPPVEAQDWLDQIRTLQLVLFHDPNVKGPIRDLVRVCVNAFPNEDWRVNRELAILLVGAQLRGMVDQPVQGKIVAALKASTDKAQQIHYFYCLRLLTDGWTADQKADLINWFDGTQSWGGGHSYVPFLENILRDLSKSFTAEDMTRVVEQGATHPFVTPILLRLVSEPQLPSPEALVSLYSKLAKAAPGDKNATEFKGVIVSTLGKRSTPQVQAALRSIADSDPSQRESVARSLASTPSAENFPYILSGLSSTNKLVVFDVLEALKKSSFKPKADNPAPIRAVLLAAAKLDEKQRWQTVVLLRQWTNKQFGANDGDWKTELASWSRWFGQVFPKEPALPDVGNPKPVVSRYKFEELLTYLEGDGKKSGDAVRGKVIFEKAQCMRCHKYGSVGEGVGPDLSAISKRFKRRDTLEAIIDPSKTISDQYRSTTFEMKKGVIIFGLASAPQNGVITVLTQDGTKVEIKVNDIGVKFESLISVMPEQLLEKFEKNEIADLFAFLESEPMK